MHDEDGRCRVAKLGLSQPSHRDDRPRIGRAGLVLICVFAAARFYLEVNNRILLFPGAGHDDGYFIRMASNIASGQWLGAFDHYTLMKGPGYPVFVAITSLYGLPITAAHAIFHILTICIFSYSVLILTRSLNFFYFSFIFLILIPASFHPEINRVIRDQIYWGQTIIIFSVAAILFLSPPTKGTTRLCLGLVLGSVLGWAWLTREEGSWFHPGLATLVIGGAYVTYKRRLGFISFLLSLASILSAFFSVQFSLQSANRLVYGSFIGVDFQDPAFRAMMAALTSVDEGKTIAQVPITAAARDRVAAVSPAFAPLAEALRKGGPFDGWSTFGCASMPHTCGEIAGGWFVWAVRDAAASLGYYRSPAEERKKFGQIASEIEAACAEGALKCSRSPDAHMPKLSTSQWLSLPTRMVKTLWKAALSRRTELSPVTTFGQDDVALFDTYWSFLNYPRTFGPASGLQESRGWIRLNESEKWPTIVIREGKQEVGKGTSTRRPSPDLATFFKDPSIANNRFTISYQCANDCTIEAEFENGDMISIPLTNNGSFEKTLGGRTLFVDSTIAIQHPAALPNKNAKIAGNIINLTFFAARIALPTLLIVGLVCFFLAVYSSIKAGHASPIILAACAAWVFVAARILVVSMVDVGSFPALNAQYMAPATYMICVSIVLSISALTHEVRQRFQ